MSNSATEIDGSADGDKRLFRLASKCMGLLVKIVAQKTKNDILFKQGVQSLNSNQQSVMNNQDKSMNVIKELEDIA